jgi:hypothetical protein
MSLLAVALAASISGSVQDRRPCPPTCHTNITVSMQGSGAARSLPGRYFLGVFQMTNGSPDLSVGGYWDGRSWQISQVPISFRRSSLAGAQARIRIEGGLCALAAAQGATGGDFAVIAGFGVDRMGDRLAEIQAAAAEADAETAAKLNAMLAQIQQSGGEHRVADFAAAQAMREDGTLREIGRVRCG